MSHSFYNSLERSRYLSLISLSFNVTLWSAGTAKLAIRQVLSFLMIIIRSSRLDEIRWSVCMSKSYRSLCVSFSWTDSGLSIYRLFVSLNFFLSFLFAQSQWITFPTQSCLILYSFCANLLHSLIMWLIVSFLSPRNLHLFCCVLSILAGICLVLMALFCVAIRKDSVYLLRFRFLSHIQVFSYEITLASRLKRPQSCLSPYFCFLVIAVLLIIVSILLFLVAVISLPPSFST